MYLNKVFACSMQPLTLNFRVKSYSNVIILNRCLQEKKNTLSPQKFRSCFASALKRVYLSTSVNKMCIGHKYSDLRSFQLTRKQNVVFVFVFYMLGEGVWSNNCNNCTKNLLVIGIKLLRIFIPMKDNVHLFKPQWASSHRNWAVIPYNIPFFH